MRSTWTIEPDPQAYREPGLRATQNARAGRRRPWAAWNRQRKTLVLPEE
jgi:hypothetical protein